MTPIDADCARDAAHDLVDLLSAYEDELLGLEQHVPALRSLRQAVGVAVAEACCWISDSPPSSAGLAHRRI